MPLNQSRNIKNNNEKSLYSFRRGTNKDLKAIIDRFYFPLMIFVTCLFMVVGLIAAFMRGKSEWKAANQAYLHELGKPINIEDIQTISDWVEIFPSTTSILILLTGAAIGLIVFYETVVRAIIWQRSSNQKLCIAQYQKKVIGWADTLEKDDYLILNGVFINPKHRQKGIGMHLVWNCLKEIDRPVYLLCYPYLQSFYRRLGFVSVPRSLMPKELSRSFLQGMMLSQEPIQPPPLEDINSLPQDKLSVRLIQDLQTMMVAYRTFWSRRQFRRSRFYLFLLLTTFLLVLLTLSKAIAQVTKIMFGLFINHVKLNTLLIYVLNPNLRIIVWLVSIFQNNLNINLTLLIGLVSMFISLVLLTRKWQEWIIKDSKGTSGYANIYCQSSYSILYYFFILSRSPRQAVATSLIACLSQGIQFPLYFSCPKNECRFYTELGFTSVSQNKLPLELKLFNPEHTIPLQLSYDTALTITSSLTKPD